MRRALAPCFRAAGLAVEWPVCGSRTSGMALDGVARTNMTSCAARSATALIVPVVEPMLSRCRAGAVDQVDAPVAMTESDAPTAGGEDRCGVRPGNSAHLSAPN
jgi:hypothetical protein